MAGEEEMITHYARCLKVWTYHQKQSLNATKKHVEKSGLRLETIIETELAYIIVATEINSGGHCEIKKYSD